MDRTEMREKLEKKLTQKRYEHSLGVEYVSGCLAMVYGADVEKALTAGLLHDCAKCLTGDEKIARCTKLGLPVSDVEKKNPELLHAKLGAYYARTKYGVTDENILSAIEFHTTGKPDMNVLEKIVFVADYIEPNRDKAPNLKEIRKTAFEDIDRAVYLIIRDTLEYLKETNSPIDNQTQKAYEYYKKLNKDE